MPLYSYQCAARCGHQEEIFRRIADRDRDLPEHCGAPMEQMIVAPMVAPDIHPYRSMIDGSLITSRSKHREHLRDHGCIEVGNERIGGRKPGEVRGDFDVRADLARATKEVLGKTR